MKLKSSGLLARWLRNCSMGPPTLDEHACLDSLAAPLVFQQACLVPIHMRAFHTQGGYLLPISTHVAMSWIESWPVCRLN